MCAQQCRFSLLGASQSNLSMPTFGELTGEMSMSGDVDVTGLETPPLPGSMFYLPCITHFHSLVYIGCLSPVFLHVKTWNQCTILTVSANIMHTEQKLILLSDLLQLRAMALMVLLALFALWCG